jgi:hypothetical protein
VQKARAGLRPLICAELDPLDKGAGAISHTQQGDLDSGHLSAFLPILAKNIRLLA